MPSDDSKEKIRRLLAEAIGVEAEDINDADSLVHELHMTPTDLSGFSETLQENGFRVLADDLVDLESFDDLAEFAAAHEEVK